LKRIIEYATTKKVKFGIEGRRGYEEIPSERELPALLDELNSPQFGTGTTSATSKSRRTSRFSITRNGCGRLVRALSAAMFRIVFGRRKIISRRLRVMSDLAKLVPLLPKDLRLGLGNESSQDCGRNSKNPFRLEKNISANEKGSYQQRCNSRSRSPLLIWVFHDPEQRHKMAKAFTKRITGGLSPLSSPTSLLKSLPLSVANSSSRAKDSTQSAAPDRIVLDRNVLQSISSRWHGRRHY